MESILLTIKFVVFLAMELFVFAMIVTALITGLYQIVRNTIQRRTAIPLGQAYLPTRGD